MILFDRALRSGLFRVPSTGGVPTAVTMLAEGEDAHRWPHFLPDGRHFFYTAVTGGCCPPAKPGVVKVGSLDPSESAVTLLQADSSAAYGSGHLVFARDQTLMAQPFDPASRTTTGDAFPLRERVGFEGSRYVSASVSQNGTLAYAPNAAPTQQNLFWFDRSGRTLGTLGEGGLNASPRLSPDEGRVALAEPTGNPGNLDIWLIDISRNLRSRLTSDARDEGSPVWSPDGTRIVFGSGAPREGAAGEGPPASGSSERDRSERNPPRGGRHAGAALWPATVSHHAIGLVRGRAVRALHVERIVSGDVRHLGPADLWGPPAVSGRQHTVWREPRYILPGRPLDRVRERRDRPAQRLRSAVSCALEGSSGFLSMGAAILTGVGTARSSSISTPTAR